MYLENIGNILIQNSLFLNNFATEGGVFYYIESSGKYIIIIFSLTIYDLKKIHVCL